MNWHEYFTYNPETGDLIWKERPLSSFSSLRAWATFQRYSGRVAGTSSHPSGYVIVEIGGSGHKAHRVIWEMLHGPIPPKMEVDHKDGVRDNNRQENLRLATKAENCRNTKLSIRNTSGYKGVSFNKSLSKYMAYIRVDRKLLYLGLYESPEVAHAAYQTAAKEHYGEFARMS